MGDDEGLETNMEVSKVGDEARFAVGEFEPFERSEMIEVEGVSLV